MSFLGPSLTKAARPFSQYMAVRPRGRKSQHSGGGERERMPTGEPRRRNESCESCSQVRRDRDIRHPQRGACCVPEPSGAALQLLGNHSVCWAFYRPQGQLLPTKILLLFCKEGAWSSGKERLCGEARNIKRRGRKWILSSCLYSSSPFFLISS